MHVERKHGPTGLAGALLFVVVGLCATPAAAAPSILKGPYLMDVQPERIAVMVELDGPARLEVIARSDAAPEVRVESPRETFHEVLLEGLRPATAYRYEVRVEGGPSEEGSFGTAPIPGEGPVDFLVMGDNRTDASAHAGVVRAMRGYPADFLLNTGDMVADGSDPRDWAGMFAVQGRLLRDLPLFPTVGNHELYRSGRGLQSYLRYTRVPRELGGGVTHYGFTYGPVRVFVLDSNEAWSRESAQRKWLEAQLAATDADDRIEHVLIAAHHGPFSSGRHGPHPGMTASDLAGLLRAHRVSLVVSGHDHLYERGSVDGLKYVVSGGGGAPLYPVNHRRPGQLAFEPSYHFLHARVEGERFTITAVRTDGSEIERCSFVGDGDWICDAAPADAPGAGPIDAGSHPAAFWTARMLARPLGWGLLVLILVGSFWLLTRRWRRRQQAAR